MFYLAKGGITAKKVVRIVLEVWFFISFQKKIYVGQFQTNFSVGFGQKMASLGIFYKKFSNLEFF